ncbi:DUF4870 domain-containing protein [Aequorivita marina]|uniref:DUF4870 domain-containing protein n=1 Tax=Aequorivita marina TaxID=3073654 RepID=UPI0028772087|nr:hypothetical protein [Aequorivita sp. S2608]MDS1298152.1 hypothetical protein [Aequorivita sp. S2608]
MNEETNTQNQSKTPSNSVEEGKTTAIIAYITIFGLLIAFIMNNDKKNTFAAYHIRQCIGLGAVGLASYIIGKIPYVGWIASLLIGLLLIVLWVIGLIGALNGQEKPVPVLGEQFQEWFKGIG